MKRTPLRRRRLWHPVRTGPREDAVTPEMHAAVLRRDRGCVLAQSEPEHLCRDQWGNTHRWDDLAKLQIEHFWSDYAVKGDRAPSTLDNMVAICGYVNVIRTPTADQRNVFRNWVQTHR